MSLRPLSTADQVCLAKWSQDPAVRAHFADQIIAVAHREAAEQQRREGLRLSMAIHLLDGPTVGLVELVDINPQARTGELRILIGEERYRGRGYGTAAIQQFLPLVFSRLTVSLIYLRVARSNARARRCYEKCGFRTRARLAVSRRQPSRHEELLLMEMATRRAADSRVGERSGVRVGR